MPIYKATGKKDGLQRYRVVVSYVDEVTGKYKQIERTAYGKDNAKLMELKLKTMTSDKSLDKMTVSLLFDEYLTSKKSEVRQTTLDKSRRILQGYVINNDIGKYKLSKLTPRAIQNWKNSIESTELAIKTKKNIFSEFRALLNYALKMEYIQKNPLVTVGNFKDVNFTKPSDTIHYYTSEQFLQFISAAKKNCEESDSLSEWGYYVFFMIAFYTGMRKGEINALRWEDVEENIIHVKRSVSQKIKGVSALETPPKNKSSYRDLQAPQPLIEVLQEHKEKQRKLFKKNFQESFRICGADGYLSDTAISNHNIRYANLAELPHITVHDFRHSHASLLANNGINIQEIARRLGHSNIEITWNTYSHLYPREEERAVEILNKIK